MENKEEVYRSFLSQLRGLISDEPDRIANLSNAAALYMQTFSPHWVGFYLVQDEQLVLGPFQGPVACTRIEYGKGVCGKAWEKQTLLNVPDVHQFPGHIACSALSNSELVAPIVMQDQCRAILDIDSTDFNHFDKVDEEYVNKMAELLSENVF